MKSSNQPTVGIEVGRDSEARQPVQLAVEAWIKALRAQISKGATARQLELSAAHPGGLASLYSLRPTALSSLVREPRSLAHARNRAREVLAYSAKMRSRYGSGELQLGIGTVAWRGGDGKHVSAPALVCPLSVEQSGAGEVLLTLYPFPQLSTQFEEALVGAGLGAAVREVLASLAGKQGGELVDSLAALRALAQGVLEDFSLYDSLTVGAYVHPLQPLLRDLEALRERQPGLLNSSPLLAALADPTSAAALLDASKLPARVKSDRDPRAEHGLGDLDAAQHNILDAVASGANLFLQVGAASENEGTLAALLADAASEGQSVAYVCADPARAQLLTRKFAQLGAEELVLDFTALSEAELRAKLLEALEKALAVSDGEGSEELSKLRVQLIEARLALGGYLEQLHCKRAPWGISAYDALQVLTDLTANRSKSPRTRVRFDLATLHRLASDGAANAQALLEKAQAKGMFTQTRAANPWIGVVISSPEMVQFVVETVRRVAATELPQVRSELERTCASTGLKPAQTLNQWQDQLRMLDGIAQVLSKFKPQVFEQSAADMMIATAPKKWRVANGYNMKGSLRRRLVRQAKGLVKPGVKLSDLHLELVEVQRQRGIWREYSQAGGWPTLPEGLEQMREHEAALRQWLSKLQPFFSTGYGDLVKIPLDQLTLLLRTLAQDRAGASELPERVALLKEIHDLGLDELLADLRVRRCQGDMVREELDLAWWASALSEILKLDERLTQFDAQSLESLTHTVRVLDREQVASLAPLLVEQVRGQLARRLRSQSETVEEVRALLLNPSLSLSDLFSQVPLLSQLVPVLILPPSLVPSYVSIYRPVDLAVIDDRAAVELYVSTLVRARQVVAVGTNSALSSCLPLLPLPQTREKTNSWVLSLLAAHSEGESELVAVPSPRPVASVRYHLLDGRGMPALGAQTVESCPQEVEEVMRLVREHALCRPDQSLAVATLNQRHAQRLQEALLSERAKHRELEPFFARTDEPFVILEPGQTLGGKRDRVILSVGFAKTPHGRQLHDFGELDREGGKEIICSALACVREDVDIVSSLDPNLFNEDRLHTPGAWMLYDLLLRAADEGNIRERSRLAGGENVTVSYSAQALAEAGELPAGTTLEIEDRLLLDLAERLYSVGLEVVPQYGGPGQWKVPLALGHPDFPGEMLVAVLTDSPAYMSEKSLRERVRHLPERLESYGWKVCTVYSSSIFRDPSGQASKLLNQVLDLVEERRRHDPRFLVRTEETRQTPAEKPAPATDSLAQRQLELQAEQMVDGIYGLPTGEIPAVKDTEQSASLPGESPVEITGEIMLDKSKEEQVYGVSREHEGDPFRPLEATDTPVGKRVGPRPPLAPGLPLSAYSDDQLDDLLHWLRSDRIARTQGQELELLRAELALTRPSAQVDLILNNVIRRNP